MFRWQGHMPSTGAGSNVDSSQISHGLVLWLAMLLSGVGKGPSASGVAALGTPLPKLAVLSFGLRFTILRSNVLPVGLLLLELLLFVLIRLCNMGLVLWAFRVP